ncbi:MAG: Mov34/MPN/PAD-1 family protein [Sphaerospermopsis kisseleviana]|uniref:Mov34/MPN/PAD-1 family protein n=1 Tax=Sphaerospermopsis reniformis TaxID=531300 RepID=A0A479ZV28_9CYAN|nr:MULTISPECIES: M67 family metallopeptidase [Sphaerospermopsis]MBD2132450.1 M67 family metallopeptidase [Sphaerospermopsis sp. FACHB-1094]MBD2145275.1 M67 family metallopeptidase [Sphaerospermopsis sp. FACHB-1194]GCL36610.1 Mov34/MPN/PAD-1 family protein [Sphaerospermopsis reniformis]
MKILKINDQNLESINLHAEKTYPDECCGLILGYLSHDVKTVVEVIPTENVWNTEKDNFTENQEEYSTRRRYAIAPFFMLQIQKEARNRNLNIIGIFHSHPDYPAIPSEWDRIYAWPEYSYIIVSVNQGKAGELNSFCLDENHQFQAETIERIILAT